MGQTAGKKRGAWFWVGVALLAISALIWLLFFLVLIFDPEDIGDTLLAAVLITIVPIGIGIYCLRHGRKAPIADTQQDFEPSYAPPSDVKPGTFQQVKGLKGRKVIVQGTPTDSEIVIKMPWWFRVVAWGELLCGILLISVGLPMFFETQDPGNWVMVGFGVFFVLLGTWMVGMITKVNFNESLGRITIIRGHVPLFLWFLRTRRISKEEAISVYVHSYERWVSTSPTSGGGYATHYEIKMITSSGKELKLYRGGNNQEATVHLADKIRDFAQEADSEAYRKGLEETTGVKSEPSAKFSMRVEETFPATFNLGAVGMVVGGTMEQGTIRSGDWVDIKGYQRTKRAKIFEVDKHTPKK